MSYQVYWLENDEPRTAPFGHSELTTMLKFTEALRARNRAGEAIKHIASSSEDPNSVTVLGVQDAPEGYMWPKRRLESWAKRDAS